MSDPRQSPANANADREAAVAEPKGPVTAADWLGPQGVMSAVALGRLAAVNGEPVTSCPWRSATAGQDLASRDMWVRGYAAGRTELRQRSAPK